MKSFLLCVLILAGYLVSTAQTTVTKQLYLSDPSQALDRVDPVATADATTAQTGLLGQIFCSAISTFSSPVDISNQLGAQDAITSDLAVYISPGGVKTLHAVFLGKDGSGDNKINIYYSSKTGAGAWSAPVCISSNNWNQDAQPFPSVKADAGNKAHVVYAHKNGTGGDSKINIYYVTNAGGAWSAPVRISSDAFNNDAFTPEIAMDAGGKAHVVYQHKSGSDSKKNIYYVTNTGGAWSAPVRVSNDGFNQDAGLNPAIALDAGNKAHVVYQHKSGSDSKINIYYVTNAGGSWSAPARISSDAFNQDAQDNPSIAVDMNSKPHVVYAHKNSNGGDGKINIYYVNKTGASWSTPVNISNDVNGQDSKTPDLAFCSNLTVRVAFSNAGREIYYTENSGAGNSWITPMDINPVSPTKSDAGLYPSIVASETAIDVVYQDHPAAGGKIDIWHVSGVLPPSGDTLTSFTQSPALCSDLIIKAGTISVTTYVAVYTGSLSVNPAITAVIRYGTTTIISLSNPTYNSGTGLLTWTGILGADVTVPATKAIVLDISTTITGTQFKIEFDSQTRPSKISLPVSTFIRVNQVNLYNAPYPGGIPITNTVSGSTKYVRAVVSDPFGTSDITALNVKITPAGTTFAATQVGTSGCTKTYEYAWAVPASPGNYNFEATAKEGYENTVTHTASTNVSVCVNCPPSAVNDSISGPTGIPLVVDVLANDSDPNNNLNPSSLSITVQPANGSAVLNSGKIVYLPNGSFTGRDTITYQVCDLTSPVPLCATAYVFVTVDESIIDPCYQATKKHTYYIPYPEQDAYTALVASANTGIPSSNIRTIISLKIPYPGVKIIWDEWEDGYESDINNPVQSTTKIWGDGDIYNGIAPGFPTDIIPAGGSIVLDNTMIANPRNPATIYYDGKDKVVSTGQIAMTQVCGEPSWMPVQAIKTNVTSVYDFGQSFTIPFGQNFNSQDFAYTSLFIRASQNNTTINIDKDNNGTFETTFTLNEGNSYLVNGGVLTGATIASDKPVGVELHSGGIDQFSVRNAPIFPSSWYSDTYFTPVPTSDNAGDNPKDSSVVMLYNSLSRALTINWSSGVPASGTITIPAKSVVRFPLVYSATAAYKFVNPTGESFTAIEIVDSYTPGGGGNNGTTYDWAFNLISEIKLTDYATVAWAPGGLDLVAPSGPDVNGNPVWVTPSMNTTVYVKYDGDVVGPNGLVSPCGLKYDVAYAVNALNYLKVRDPNDNDQSGIALYTCNGAKIAAVYGEDPQGSGTGIGVAYWDVGTTIQPFCKQKLIFAKDDNAVTMVSQPVTVSVLQNDYGFLAAIDPSSLSTTGLLQPLHGTVTVNTNGTLLYTPDPGYAGVDTFQYNICSTPSPVVCDNAYVYIKITACPSGLDKNLISGQVFLDKTKDGINNDGGAGFAGIKVYLYTDGNCNGIIDAAELTDSTIVDSSGTYQFLNYPEKIVADDFDAPGGISSCASGSDGNSAWLTNWVDVDAKGATTGFCITGQSEADTDVEMVKDGSFSYALRLDDKSRSATRTVNLSGATKAFLTFSYRRASASLTSGEDIQVQLSANGSSFTTIYTITGDGNTDAGYVTIYNQDITAFASASTYIRFLTNANVDEGDFVFIDSVSIRFLKYNQCYITKIAPSSIPVNNYLTTVAQKTTTFTSSATCESQFDFGVAKNSISVSGTVYNDNNGLKDGAVNGTVTGTTGGNSLWAYLVDTKGKVSFKTTVDAVTGVFTFPIADVNTNYTLMISTTSKNQFETGPSSADLPAAWASVGEAFGVNNAAGTGNKSGSSASSISVITGTSNVTGIKFGIERIPDSDDHFATVARPSVNQFITLNGGTNPPVLSGSDPEDCNGGCILTGKSVYINSIPENAELYYNGIYVSYNETINNFNPNLFQIKITDETLGDTTVSFLYSFIDAAGIKDATPATYKIYWPVPLPADRLVAEASLNGSVAIIQWSTLSEQNTAYFTVERSTDNSRWSATGNQVTAAGNSVSKTEYRLQDNISGLTQNDIIYYRVMLTDLDGKMTLSNVVPLRLKQKAEISIWPNPFISYINISIKTERETILDVNLIDVSGNIIKKSSQSASRGIVSITLSGLGQLPLAVYLVEVFDRNTGTKFQKLLRNQ